MTAAVNLTQLKASAEAAKASPLELDFWREEISPDDVLRLVEVARAIYDLRKFGQLSSFEDDHIVTQMLDRVMKGIEA